MTLASVHSENFSTEAPPPPGGAGSHQLVGVAESTGSTVSLNELETLKSFFLQNGPTYVLGKRSDGAAFSGLVSPTLPFGPFYRCHLEVIRQNHWATRNEHQWVESVSFYSLRDMLTAMQPTKIWWFSDGSKSKLSTLARELRLNPHFPVDELELLPRCILREGDTRGDFSSAFTTVEQLLCPWDSSTGLAAYCASVPAPLRTLRRVTVAATGKEVSGTLVDDLRQVFCSTGLAAAHTLILEGVSTEVITSVVEACLPSLSRLVLRKCPNVDFNQILPSVAKNKVLEEFSFENGNTAMNCNTFELVRDCGHVAFPMSPNLSVPPPKASAAASPATPLPEAMKLEDFLKLCKQNNPPMGLVTAYGRVVPLARDLIPRFQLIQGMLEVVEKVDENLVPLELEPPVSKESVALAVHFISHYLPDEVHKECEAAEAQQHGDGSSSSSSSTAANSPSSSFSWCSNFAQFRAVHIQQRYGTPQRRMQVMCELMALAAYLNCPSLKRFLRAALVMEEMEEATNVDRGKRDRGSQQRR